MTYALLNRDGTFREWVVDPDLTRVRPGSVLPQVVDKVPDFDAATQAAIEGVPRVENGSVRKTWLVVDLPAVREVTTLEFVSRFTPEEWVEINNIARSSGDLLALITHLIAASSVRLDDTRIRDGLLTTGIFTEERIHLLLS